MRILILASLLFLSACAVPMTKEQRYAVLSEVNTQVNAQIKYKKEKKDVWHTYDEVMKTNTGDCEEYAIVKCVILTDKFNTDRNLAILVAKSLKKKSAHAVLLVDDYYVLDNQSKSVYPIDNFLEEWEPKLSLRHCAVEEIKSIKGTAVKGSVSK